MYAYVALDVLDEAAHHDSNTGNTNLMGCTKMIPILNNFGLPNYQYIIVYKCKFIFVGQGDDFNDDGGGGGDDDKPLHLSTDSSYC